MQARAARAHSIAAASGAGINLASNRFLALLQTTAMASVSKSQVELEDEQNAQEDNLIKTQSELNSKASSPTFMGWFAQSSLTFIEGAYGGSPQESAGVSASGGDALSSGRSDPGADANNMITPDDLGGFEGAGQLTGFGATSMGGGLVGD